MRQANKLTALGIARLKVKGRYSDGHGLWLQVSEAGNKAWLFRYMLNGRARQMGLGPLHTVSLAEARIRARQARQVLLDGLDPLDAKRKAKTAARIEQLKTVTFKQCAEDFMKVRVRDFKNEKHRAQWRSTLETYAFPIIGSLPVAEIDTPLVLKVLRPLWERAPETASRLRGRIERVLAWATAQEYRQGDNPARWRGHLADMFPVRPKVKHHAALPYEELPAFMARLRGRDSISARALEFTVLTTVRTSEAIGARWDEIDLESKLWVIPAERMKADRPHRVPLSDRAVEILTALPRDTFLFPGSRRGKPLSNMAMLELLRGVDGNGYTVHGFRSTFSDWARDRTAYSRDVIELALAHKIKDKAEAAYRRKDALEKRRRLMVEWGRYCNLPPVAGEVVGLRHG